MRMETCSTLIIETAKPANSITKGYIMTELRNAPIPENLEGAMVNVWTKAKGLVGAGAKFVTLAMENEWKSTTFLSPNKAGNGSTCTPELWAYFVNMAELRLTVTEQALLAAETAKGMTDLQKSQRKNARIKTGAMISDLRKTLKRAENAASNANGGKTKEARICISLEAAKKLAQSLGENDAAETDCVKVVSFINQAIACIK
jgi:hypothetical protein